MKKFSLFATLAAIATVGSVFAAWQFSEGKEQTGSKNDLAITVDNEVIVSGLAGTTTVVCDPAPSFKIVQDGSGKSAMAVVATEGDIEVTYTPAEYETTTTVTITYTISLSDDKLDTWFNDSTWTVTETVNKAAGKFVDTLTDDEIAAKVVGIANAVPNAATAKALIAAVGTTKLNVAIEVEDASA